jgi:hydrogenase maturation protease
LSEPLRPAPLVLALGNDILGDDAVGLLAARRLAAALPEGIEVVEAPGGGLALLDLLEGRERALILDAILTGNFPAGTVLEFATADFAKVEAPSPHFAGLPEVLRMVEVLGIPFPSDIRILAMEVADPYEVREGLTPPVERALPALVERAREIVQSWPS